MVFHWALAIICVWLVNVEIVILSGIVLVYSLICNKKVLNMFGVLLYVNKFGSVEFVYVLHFEYFQFTQAARSLFHLWHKTHISYYFPIDLCIAFAKLARCCNLGNGNSLSTLIRSIVSSFNNALMSVFGCGHAKSVWTLIFSMLWSLIYNIFM